MWETIDLLQKHFGKKRTQAIIKTPSPFTYFLDDFYPHT